MRVIPDNNTLSSLASSADNIANAQADGKKTKQISSANPLDTKSQTKNDTTDKTEKVDKRETYGLDTIKNMSDEEYAAFERATANMSPTEKMRAAQSLHLVAKSYQQAQSTIGGGGLVDYLNGKSDFFSQNQNVLEQGIQVLKQMNNNDSRAMSSFLTRYKGALASSGLNLTA